jgi:hypothetical protein
MYRLVFSPGPRLSQGALLKPDESEGLSPVSGGRTIRLCRLPCRTSAGGPDEDEKECDVCLSQFEKYDLVRMLPCRHEFHADCIDKWLREKDRRCPCCRVICARRPRGSWMSAPVSSSFIFKMQLLRSEYNKHSQQNLSPSSCPWDVVL